MPRYECKGNIWHNDVYYSKGSFVELPEGEKSDLFVLVAPALAVMDEPTPPAPAPLFDVSESSDETPFEAPKRGRRKIVED